MSWIKNNKFTAVLVGGTLLAVLLLFFWGSNGSGRYDEAMTRFTAAAEEVNGFEKLRLSPKIGNKDGKTKALASYRQALDGFQAAFESYRPKDIKDVTPQEFTTDLLATNTEVRKAFEDAGATVPEPFFVGFESYKSVLANGKTTGLLGYQLSGIKELMLALAKSKPKALNNLYRPRLPEEDGQTFTPPSNAVTRSFPLEITFTGPEKSARDFLTSIAASKNRFFIVRSIRVSNEKKTPPMATDAKFDSPAVEKPQGDTSGFGGGFVLPGDSAPSVDGAPVAEAPASKQVDTSRILSQVLGNEQVNVFIRLDLLQFLPAKKLP